MRSGLRLGMLLLAALGLFPAHARSTPLSDEKCRTKGGVPFAGDCQCLEGELFIDPEGEMACPVRAISDTLALLKALLKAPLCGNEIHAADQGFPSGRLVPQDELCSNPAKHFCDPSFNPAAARIGKIEEHFEALRLKAESQPSVQSMIRDKGGSRARRCENLETKDFTACQEQVDRLLRAGLLTPERVSAANRIFEKARGAVLEALARRKVLAAPSAAGKERIKDLDLMIDRVRSALVSFESKRPRYIFNASAVGGQVQIEGVALLATEMPEALLRTLMHELAHVADGDPETVLLSQKESGPFETELRCLMRPDVAKLKVGDGQCYIRQGFVACGRAIEENPRGSKYCRDAPKACQLSQTAEGFADWLGVEAYAVFREDSLKWVPHRVVEGGVPLVDLSEKLLRAPFLGEAIGDHCLYYARQTQENEDSMDSYPPSAVRLNAIFFAHPQIRAALGCTGSLNPVLRRLDEPVVPGRVTPYCGSIGGTK